AKKPKSPARSTSARRGASTFAATLHRPNAARRFTAARTPPARELPDRVAVPGDSLRAHFGHLDVRRPRGGAPARRRRRGSRRRARGAFGPRRSPPPYYVASPRLRAERTAGLDDALVGPLHEGGRARRH